MVKTKSEKVLGKMILSRIGKIKDLIKEAESLNQSNKRYRSTMSRIIEDIYEITSELSDLEDEYNSATDDAYEELENYLHNDIEDAGYDLDDDEFISVIKKTDFKLYTNFIKKRLKKLG